MDTLMHPKAWFALFAFSLLSFNALSSNTLVYPISVHFFKGQYYIADRGQGALLTFKDKIPHAITKNNVFTVPLGLSDDHHDRLLISDPGYCTIRSFDVDTYSFSLFSRPKDGQGCPRFLSNDLEKIYAYTSETGYTEINHRGKQVTHTPLAEVTAYGIAFFKTPKRASAFAIANPAHRIIYVLNQQTLSPMTPLCHGTQLRFPYDIVSFKNKLYIDDVILNALFEYDPATGQCVKLPYEFIKPMGLTVAGDKIGIIDAGKRALIEYTPKIKRFKMRYEDKTPLNGLRDVWDFYVTDRAVFVTDPKRAAILRITKSTPCKMTVLSDAGHGEGPPFLTIYDIASNEKLNHFYVSDATTAMILKVDKKTGNRSVFSEGDRNKGPKLGDVTSMTLNKGILYAADWSNSLIAKIDSFGNRQVLVKLDSPPFAISKVINSHIYVTQLKRHAISRIHIKTGKYERLQLHCPDLGTPLGIVAWDDNHLMVSDSGNNTVLRINLKAHRCDKIASVPTLHKNKIWLMKRYDEEQLLIGVSNDPHLYLVNVRTGRINRFA